MNVRGLNLPPKFGANLLAGPSLRKNFIGLMGMALMFAVMPRALLADESVLFDRLKSGGHFAIMRHATAPGTGDPDHFELDNCSTQRNLSDEGRRQAVAIGNTFRAHGVYSLQLVSSQWCRCLETAKLLGFGPAEEQPALNSFFGQFEREGPQTQMLKDWLARQDLDKPLLMVTHQVNITALTGVYPAAGEIVVVQRLMPAGLKVLGRYKSE